jgi:hypothetical protein
LWSGVPTDRARKLGNSCFAAKVTSGGDARRHLRFPFTQEITGSNPVGGIDRGRRSASGGYEPDLAAETAMTIDAFFAALVEALPDEDRRIRRTGAQ